MQSHRLPGHEEAEEGVRDEQMWLRERGDSRVRSGRSERQGHSASPVSILFKTASLQNLGTATRGQY